MIMGWQYLWILAAAAAVLCAVGFYKFVYKVKEIMIMTFPP